VGTGFYRLDDHRPVLLTDPTAARHHPNDRGGNALCITRRRSACGEELHGYWDTTLVTHLASRRRGTLAALLLHTAADPAWRTAHPGALAARAGDHHDWAAAWAAASVHEAAAAYDGLAFGDAVLQHGTIQSIATILPGDYPTVQRDRVLAQLVGAAVHLAQLLNALHWPRVGE